MQHGKILQTGSPEQIYQRPTSEAVVSFFGSPNMLDATVTGIKLEHYGLIKLSLGQGRPRL
jgi:ABC-type Fe3+/spermidine/putrescine transport system ATPase subunit